MRACSVRHSVSPTSKPHVSCLLDNVLSRRLQAYYRVYKEHIPVAQLCREVAAVMQEFTRACPKDDSYACDGDMLNY